MRLYLAHEIIELLARHSLTPWTIKHYRGSKACATAYARTHFEGVDEDRLGRMWSLQTEPRHVVLFVVLLCNPRLFLVDRW